MTGTNRDGEIAQRETDAERQRHRDRGQRQSDRHKQKRTDSTEGDRSGEIQNRQRAETE